MRIITLFSVLFCVGLSACSTYVEELASDEFAPVFPEEIETTQVADGAIFDGNAQGLFASERKASKVGDILTISLSHCRKAYSPMLRQQITGWVPRRLLRALDRPLNPTL
jgi:flagellar L-ring protein precursor FlgH